MLSEKTYTTIKNPVITEKAAIQKSSSNTFVYIVGLQFDLHPLEHIHTAGTLQADSLILPLQTQPLLFLTTPLSTTQTCLF